MLGENGNWEHSNYEMVAMKTIWNIPSWTLITIATEGRGFGFSGVIG
jgi:hypothetical protein